MATTELNKLIDEKYDEYIKSFRERKTLEKQDKMHSERYPNGTLKPIE